MQVPHTYSVPQPLPSSVKLYSICRQTDTDNNYTIYGLYQDFTDLTCLSCVNLLKSQRHGLVKSTQVPHAYSVSEPLPTYVHLCRSRHPKTTPIYEYVAELDHIMLSTCAKLMESLNYAGIKSMQVPHTYSVSQPLP